MNNENEFSVNSEAVNNETVNNNKENNNQGKKKDTARKVLIAIIWAILILWAGICIWDYARTVNDKSPKFCLKKVQHKYDDGTVEECIGMGYKVYRYDRTSYKAIQFGPFWIDEHEPESK